MSVNASLKHVKTLVHVKTLAGEEFGRMFGRMQYLEIVFLRIL